MAKQKLSDLKKAFSAGMRPTEQDFHNLLESAYNGHETIWVSGYGFFEEKTKYTEKGAQTVKIKKNGEDKEVKVKKTFDTTFVRKGGAMHIAVPENVDELTKVNIECMDQEDIFGASGKDKDVIYGYRLHVAIPTPYNEHKNYLKNIYLSVDLFNDDKDITGFLTQKTEDIVANISIVIHYPISMISSASSSHQISTVEVIEKKFTLDIQTKKSFVVTCIEPEQNLDTILNELKTEFEKLQYAKIEIKEGGKLVTNILEHGGIRLIPLIVNLPLDATRGGGGVSVTIDVLYEIDKHSNKKGTIAIEEIKDKMVDKFYGIGAVFTSEQPPAPPATTTS